MAGSDTVSAAQVRLPLREVLAVAAGVAVSAGLLWAVSREPLVVLAFVAGMALLAVLLHLLLRLRPEVELPDFAVPDWSVTHAAIDRPDEAVAITDRAGRLVCANGRFGEWFGASAVPPRLPVDPVDADVVENAGRAAWRDGRAHAAGVAAGQNLLRLDVHRAGRGENYLVWRFVPVAEHNILAEVAGHVGGKTGRALAREGIQTAMVAPDGQVLAANAAFALRAAGSEASDLVGTDFVGWFRSDEHERVFYASEGAKGAPVRFVHVPVADPDEAGDVDPARTASLFLLIDDQAGIGDPRAGLPQIEALLSRLPLGLAMTDRDGRFLFANRAFLRAAGHEDPNVPPTYPSDLVIREDKGALADAVRRYAQGTPMAGDVAVRLRAAPDEPVSLSLAGVRGLGEGAVLLSLKDSSEETRLKREIAQATKMQAVGQLAGGVAHDFNNVLTAIIGYCDLMLMRHTPGDSDYDDIQQIKANSNRAASLTRQLLAFSRQQTLRPEVLQLPDVVAEVSTLLKRLLGEKISLEVTHDRELGFVRADPVQLEQVLLNLAVNARDAMAGGKAGGILRLKTRRITAADVRAMKSEILPIGDYTALIVEDTGHGIKPSQIGKIFEPFFTTKEKGKGTGLGLSTVYGIVKQSGGFIFAESEVGRGTKFTVYLPVHVPDPADLAEAAKPKAEARRAEWSGGGRVLLVEDEDTVRAVAERALVRQGYEVVTAADGEEGLEALGRTIAAGGDFDLVVSDVVMPSMDGPAMAREIRRIRADLPVLFMSGYAEEQLRRDIDIPNMHFLAKPFSVAQIVAAVEDVLRAG
ncbi:response regulator [Novosphingobium sp. KCTC 2891]|uniref:hybrid sensor histidine kinase/response regulator n=1 Tax=Novosphingobium sp. KCTC 2891 TaxID=2989730 RepID=UPI002223E5AF|nr:PAS domain-containing sensor histidine kinase [Novosphingobium sp. KCTC 2891]MCW1382921.1 response regulator [Novosphingobium sp. KCTC 2891]